METTVLKAATNAIRILVVLAATVVGTLLYLSASGAFAMVRAIDCGIATTVCEEK